MEQISVTRAPSPVRRPVADGQVPNCSPAAGDALLEELEVHVQCLLGTRILDFQIIATAGGLVLRGNSNTWYAKQLAQQAVMEATRVRILANEIEVSQGL